MQLLSELQSALNDHARLGSRGAARDGRLSALMPRLRALADKAPAVKPLYNTLENYLENGCDSEALPSCALLLRRLRLALCVPAAPPEGYAPLASRDAPQECLSARSLAGLRAALLGGQSSELLRKAHENGEARDPRLLPLWLSALEQKSLRPLAVQVFSDWGAFARPALLRYAETASAEGRCAVADIAALSFPYGEALAYLRRTISADGETRAHAMLLLGRHSREPEDVVLLSFYLDGTEEREAALEALATSPLPEAGQALLDDAERCLAAQDFTRLPSVLRYGAKRIPGSDGPLFYRFFTRLLPLLICRPGNYIRLVQLCIDAIGDYNPAESVRFLEEMLLLAQSRCEVS